LHEFRYPGRSGMGHVQNAVLRTVGRQLSVLREVSKFWAHRESECLDLLWCDSRCLQHCGARFVWNQEVISGAAIPCGVDCDGIGDDDHAFAASARSPNLLERI